MFAKIVIFALLIEQLSFEVAAQVLCSNPITIGELRVYKSKRCVDLPNKNGVGSAQTHLCDGGADQKLILCGDGTIRNEARNYCFTPTGYGNDNVRSSPCRVYPSIPNIQKWRFGRTKRFYDSGGILQEAKEIINVHSGRCLDVRGRNGHGNIGVYRCENLPDQYFYFRSRGKQIAFGRLRNEKSHQCLDVSGYDGKGNVNMYNCENKADQWFRYYQNGELVNEQSGYCLDVSGHNGHGNIGMYPCEDRTDQMWRIPKQYCNGKYCSFVNKKSGRCLDVSGWDGRGGVGTYHCEALADQRLKFVSDRWTAPTAKWVSVACNGNGKVSHAISSSVSYSSTITTTITTQVSASIEADLVFGKSSVSTSISTSLSTAWTNTHSASSTITLSCDTYDNGDAFARGCMWQLHVRILIFLFIICCLLYFK